MNVFFGSQVQTTVGPCIRYVLIPTPCHQAIRGLNCRALDQIFRSMSIQIASMRPKLWTLILSLHRVSCVSRGLRPQPIRERRCWSRQRLWTSPSLSKRSPIDAPSPGRFDRKGTFSLASKWCKWWSRNASTLCIFLRSPFQTYRTRPATERSPGGVICTWARPCASSWCCGAKTFLLEGRRRTFWVKHSCGLRMRQFRV